MFSWLFGGSSAARPPAAASKKRARDADAPPPSARAPVGESVRTAVDRVLACVDGWTDACGVPPKVTYRVDYSSASATLAVRSFDLVTKEQLEAARALFSDADEYRLGSFACRVRDRSVAFEIVRRSVAEQLAAAAAAAGSAGSNKRARSTRRSEGEPRDAGSDSTAPASSSPASVPPEVLQEDREEFAEVVAPVAKALRVDSWTCVRRPSSYDVEFRSHEFRSAALDACPPGAEVHLDRGVLLVTVPRTKPEIIL